MPKVAGTVDPRKWLAPEQLKELEAMERLRDEARAIGPLAPHCHRVTEAVELELASALLSCGLCVLVDSEDVPKGPGGSQ